MIPETHLSPATADVLLELVNIGVGRAARALSELTNREVAITVPTLELLGDHAHDQSTELCHGITLRISQGFSGDLNGQAMLVLNSAGATRVAELLLGKSPGDEAFDDNEQSAMLELGNIIIGNVMGTFANELDTPVNYDLPQLQLRGVNSYCDLISDFADPAQTSIIIMRASLAIKADKISGYFLLVFPEAGLHHLVTKLTCLETS